MSAARADALPAAPRRSLPWTPYGGVCYRCGDGYAWSVPLQPLTMLCWPCADIDLAIHRAQMADQQQALVAFEQSRRDHAVSCRWCGDYADEHGRIPPRYRCPRFAKAVLAMAAASPR